MWASTRATSSAKAGSSASRSATVGPPPVRPETSGRTWWRGMPSIRPLSTPRNAQTRSAVAHGLVAQVAVAQQQDPRGIDQPREVVELLAVAALGHVVPEVRPAGLAAHVLRPAGGEEVGLGLEPGLAQVRPVRVRPLHRVAQDGDQPHRGQQVGDALLRVPVVEVEHRALAAQRPRRGGVEERLVVVAAPHVLAPGLDVTRATPGRGRRAVGEEELRLLDRRQEQLRVLGERAVQRRGAGLRRPDDQEVGQAHAASGRPASRSTSVRSSWAPSARVASQYRRRTPATSATAT